MAPSKPAPRIAALAAAALLLLAAPAVAAGPSMPAAAAAAGTLQEPATQEPEHAAQEPEHGAGQEPAGEAAVQEHFEEEEHAAPKAWWYWPSKWINFLALCALLYWMLVVPPAAIQDIFSFPGLKVVFIERAKAILAARELAAEQKGAAALILSESEQRLARIEEEVAALVADARSDAEREKERAAADGSAQASKIAEVAQREITHQRVAAQRQLRGFVADLAVSMAEKSLAKHLTDDDQDRLIREYLARLGQSMA